MGTVPVRPCVPKIDASIGPNGKRSHSLAWWSCANTEAKCDDYLPHACNITVIQEHFRAHTRARARAQDIPQMCYLLSADIVVMACLFAANAIAISDTN